MPVGIVQVRHALRFMPPKTCATALCTLFVLLSGTAAPLSAQPLSPMPLSIGQDSPITLERAIANALRSNPDLAAAANEVAATEAAIDQAAIRPNPEAAMSMEDLKKETRTTTVQINQAIELGGKRRARVEAAERGRDAAMLDRDAKQAEIRAAVIAAFFDVLIAQERLILARSSSELAQRGTIIAARRVAAGKISPVEETKARVAQANVQLELTQAQTELEIARRRLSAFWGEAVPRFSKADGSVDTMPALALPEELVGRLKGSPLLKRAQMEVERRTALAAVENSRRVPNVTVSLGVKRAEDLGRNQAVIGLSVPLPLFDRNQGNLLEALRRTDKARNELAATEVRLQNELYQATAQLQSARQEIDALQKEILPGAQSAYDAAAKGFEYGKFSFLEVLDAQRTLLQAKSQYLRAVSNIHRSAAELQRILGDALVITPPAIQKNQP